MTTTAPPPRTRQHRCVLGTWRAAVSAVSTPQGARARGRERHSSEGSVTPELLAWVAAKVQGHSCM
jgi:hypothetical protein